MNVSMLESVPLFAGLSQAQRDLIAERMILESRRVGEQLYTYGEPATKMYLIKSGWVRLISDQRTILANVSQGSLVGDGEVLLGQSYSTSAKAASEVSVWVLNSDDLAEIVGQDLQIGMELSKALGAMAAPLLRFLVDHRLRPLPGFGDVPDQTLVTMASRLRVHTADAGEPVFVAGQAPHSIFLLEQGRIGLTDAGKPVLEFAPGDLVGEPNVFADRAHAMTARAIEPCWLWELSVTDMERLCAMYPDMRTLLGGALRAGLSAADQSRAVTFLRNTPIFQSLPAVAIAELASRLNWEVVPAGKRIFEADTAATAMFLVESGAVELLNQRDQPIARITSGGYFGEMGLLASERYGIAAQARSATNLWVLTAEDVESVARRYPVVHSALMSDLAVEKDVSEEHFAERYLRHSPLFAGLSADQIREVAQRLHDEQYRASEPVYRRGTAATALYLVEQGQISLQTPTPDGGARVLAALGPGEFCGETALLTGEPHSADAFALTDTSVWALTRADFEALLLRYPNLALNLSRALSRRLRESDEQVATATRTTPLTYVQPAKAVTARTAEGPAPRVSAIATAALDTLSRSATAASEWFGALSTGAKLRFVAVVILIVWLLFVPIASLLIAASGGPGNSNARSVESYLLNSSALIAFAADLPTTVPATYTPWPTETPWPTATLTPTEMPTNTPPPTPTLMPTATEIPPTPTRRPPTRTPAPEVQAAAAAAPQAAAPQPAVAAAAPARTASKQYQLAEWRHLSGCENHFNHNMFVTVVDAAGNPLDGVRVGLKSGDMAGDLLDLQVSGAKGPGKLEFVLYKGGAYAAFVTEDGANPANTDVTPPSGTVRDPAGEVWPAERCNGEYGNEMGHNSFNVIFKKNF